MDENGNANKKKYSSHLQYKHELQINTVNDRMLRRPYKFQIPHILPIVNLSNRAYSKLAATL